MKAIATALTVLSAPALADGYAEHDGVILWTDRPCTEAVGSIDAAPNTLADVAAAGMAWGFLLGYDTARGGLQGDEETTLTRLRKACAQSPETPAIDLLSGF